ncbi:LamG domain-containing protein [Candidatus Micrarchaeota archaeon]|nr:LamG domain-containing protein [Candidatus Micrarchaeota archaeon]
MSSSESKQRPVGKRFPGFKLSACLLFLAFLILLCLWSVGAAPTVALNSPANDANFNYNTVNTVLNATASDADSDPLTVEFFVNYTSPINDAHALVYKQISVAAGSTLTYNITSVPYNAADTANNWILLHLDNRSEYGELTTMARDFSPRNLNATCAGSTCPEFGYTSCKFGGCMYFDGVDDNYTINGTSFSPPSEGTLTLWLNASVCNAGASKRCRFFGTGDQFEFKVLNSTITTYLVTNEACAVGSNILYSSGLNYNQLYFVALTYNTTTDVLKTYVNGVLNKQDKNASGACTVGVLRLGRVAIAGEYYKGYLDDVVFWNRTLTASEIWNLYQINNGTYDWRVNASDASLETESNSWYFTVGGNVVETTINATGLAFGGIDANTNNNPNVGGGPIRLTSTANSNIAVDVYINATNMSFGANNITAPNISVWTADVAASSTPLNQSPAYLNNSGANQGFYENLAANSNVDLYFWLDVPSGQAPGAYAGSLNIRVVQDGGTP